MSSKEFLNKIRYIDMMINCKLEQVAELRSMLLPGAIRYDKDKVQTSHDADAMGDTISKVIELEEKINSDIDELVDLKSVARDKIERMENDIEKVILYKRYFNNESFENIAVECGYSWRHIHRLHGEALKNFDKLYNVDNMTQYHYN